ncbi:hypothetical protein BRC97_02255 [Halobacteriales archaeon QS_6_71_20]|nr:MAG: hypothetical protein BRC97_02255 [Halobacteriales archaeon QS_6_71_20]
MTDPEAAVGAERFDGLPSPTGGVVALLLVALALGLLAGTPLQRRLLAGGTVGAVVTLLGGRLWRRGRPVAGVAATAGGCLLLALAVGGAASRPARVVDRLELLPGLVGLWTLAAALAPLRRGRSRLLVDAGAGLAGVAVLVCGVIEGASTPALVAAGTTTVLAWDAAGNAVSVGGQVGGRGATARAELVHVTASGAVGAVAVAAVLGVTRLGVERLPLAALVALLLAGVVLALVTDRGRRVG